MAYTSEGVDPGVNTTLGVCADTTASGVVQAMKLLDPTPGSLATTGVDANPLRVRPRRRGTADYDSSAQAVPTSLTAITVTVLYIEGGWLANSTSQPVEVTITDSLGTVIFFQEVAPKTTLALPYSPGMSITGFSWGTNGIAGVTGQLWGAQ